MTQVLKVFGKVLPTKLQHKLMMKALRKNYLYGSYNEVYRGSGRVLTESERAIIQEFIVTVRNKSNKTRPDILDIGCGNAKLYDCFILELGAWLTGIDISESQIQEAKWNAPTMKFICGDFTNYDFEQSYDGITSFYSFYNFPRKMHKEVLTKMYNLLRDKGVMLINVRIDEAGAFDYKDDWCGEPIVFSYYGSKVFKKLAEEVGFDVYTFSITNNPEYVWLMLKKG